MKTKQVILLMPLLFLPLLLAGCWDKQELRDIAIVLGLGFDRTEAGELQLTVELAQRENGADSGESVCFTACGETRQAAEEALEQLLDKQLFWGNLSLLLFGQGVSYSDMAAMTLTLYQDGRINSATPLFRSDDPAAAVLNGHFGEAAYVSQGLVQAVERDQRDSTGVYCLADHLEQLVNGVAEREVPTVGVNEAGEVYLEAKRDNKR